jgi:asparagine synthase (glutamine-hydrolysing)
LRWLRSGETQDLCGITGYTHRDGVLTPDRIREATHSLIHRGPDQQGVYESGQISLGSVRLKIIDLCSGEQPMFSDDRNTVLVFNGEIYNYPELRDELEECGYRFRSNSDTEVVLRAFEQWDTDCFARFRGMFAVAIWQERRGRLVLTRDRLGIKPLYFCQKDGELYFGSELKALFAHPEIDRRLDLTALHHYLSLNYVPCPRTLVEGIEKLPPGHFLTWHDGEIRLEAYWRLQFTQKNYGSSEAAQEELDELLRKSVREHLVADVPLGIWLSGGVDSSSILHYTRQVSGARLKTFSILFQGRSFDETEYIREVARRYDTEHHELDLNPDLDLATAVEELSYYSDEPFADAGAVPVWFLSLLSRRHVTVALSGEGADELFGGYITYKADRYAALARHVPEIFRKGVLGLLRYWPVSDDKISLEYQAKRFLEGTQLHPDEAHTYWNGTFSAEQQNELLLGGNGFGCQSLFDEGLPCADGRGSLNRYLAFDQRYYLTDDILQKADRMSMAHSLEVRPPYLDHRIVEFAAGLPEHMKMDGKQQKVILKKLMRGKLPSSVLSRPKTGLDIPTHDWLRGVLRPLLLDTLSESAIEKTKLFRADRLEQLIKDHLERRANLGYHLWGLLILFLWIKQWNIQTAEMEPAETRFARAGSPA